jgi:tetratricopeptide (TPR) repeat protein
MSARTKTSSPNRNKSSGLIAAVLAAVIFLVFSPSLRNGFVKWDDDVNFLFNPYYRGLGWTQLRWMFTTFHMGPYQPLSWLTLGLDYRLWGMDARGYHLTSLLIHAANGVLLYFLARRLMISAAAPEERADPVRYDLAAAFAALVFAVHPLRVESVAWVTERRDVLSGFFFLAAILIYVRAAEMPAKKWRWLCAALAAFVLALLSKAIVVTLPVVLLLLDVYPLKRLSRPWLSPENAAVLREKIPFFLLSAAFGPLGLWGQKISAEMRPLESYGLAARLAQAFYGMALYLSKTVLPIRLLPLYELPKHLDPLAAPFIVAAVLVVFVKSVAFALRKKWPAAWIAWLYFFVTLAPVLGVVQFGAQIAADRYTYLPSMGLAVLAGGVLLALMRKNRASLFIAGLVVASLGVLTWRQSRVWHDTESLWSHALSVDPKIISAHNNLGLELVAQGRVQEGVRHYEEALSIDSDSADAHNNLGKALELLGRRPEAVLHYREALRINPHYGHAYNNLGSALMSLGQTEQAIAVFQEALAMDPKDSMAQNNWGDALAGVRRFDEALAHYREALRLKPDFPEAHNNMGVAFSLMGRPDDAIASFREAMKIDPNYATAAHNLARIYVGRANASIASGRLDKAVEDFQEALAVDSKDLEAINNMGVIFLRQGRRAEAADQFRAALRIRPDDNFALANLDRALRPDAPK